MQIEFQTIKFGISSVFKPVPFPHLTMVPEGSSAGVSWGFYRTFLLYLKTRRVTSLEKASH